MGDSSERTPEQGEQTPTTEELQQPSTEKPADCEPKAADPKQPEPSHQAVGIGVIGGPLVEPEEPDEDAV